MHAGFLFWLGSLIGCAGLPKGYERSETQAFTDTAETLLGQAARELVKGKSGSGFSPLIDGLDAFAARMLLAEVAERSIDVQYYIWHGDETGLLMVHALLKAADRGVRVRILVDDINLGGRDQGIMSLDSHPNIEVRLFNPFVYRGARLGEMIFSFGRINRRMHNKSFTVDNQFTIVGGRNIGNEYFDKDPLVNFKDFDVLAVGPVVQEVSNSFDKYWASETAVPIAILAKPVSEAIIQKFRNRLDDNIHATRKSDYATAVIDSDFIKSIEQRTIKFYWGEAHVLYDEPEKVQFSPEDTETHLVSKIDPLIEDTREEFIVISPYFIPGKHGLNEFSEATNKGVRIKVLTNSLASTDVGMVYSGYAKYRIPLIEMGVELHETKHDAKLIRKKKEKRKAKFSSGSRSSLHSKIYVFDRQKVFVGSFNLDPRSSQLNTELGILFENSEFARALGQWWDENIRDVSYTLAVRTHPTSDPRDRGDRSIIWLEKTANGMTEYIVEPHTGVWRRTGMEFMQILPIESQL